MDDHSEVVITSDYSGQQWNCCVWDLATGSSLKAFKNGTSISHTLCVVGQDYLLSAEPNQSIINVWGIRSTEKAHQRIVTPGRVSSLTTTADGAYCIGAISEKIFIWQICTGELLKTISRHYQPITCLRMTDHGLCFISAGQDSLVFVWDLERILNSVMHASIEDDGLLYSWSHHSLAVTDVHLGKGGRRARAATSSLDQTCRLYSLASGDLLLTVVFDVSLTAITMDNAEYFMFCGSTDGRIFQVNLFEPPPTSEYHFNKEVDKAQEFLGHEKAVLTLAVSGNGRTLVSGSHDNTAKIWNIASRQCLRVLTHIGAVTNVLLLPKHYGINSRLSLFPKVALHPFQHQPRSADNVNNPWKHVAVLQITSPPKDELPHIFELARMRQYKNDELFNNLQQEIQDLKKINTELFNVALDKAT